MSRFVFMREDYDCLRAAIATLIGCTYEETVDTVRPASAEYAAEKPGWVFDNGGELLRHAEDWIEQWQAWAGRRGLMMVHFPFSVDPDDPDCDVLIDDDWRAHFELELPGEWIASIRSRTPGRSHLTHLVVMRGAELLHDPKAGVDGELRIVGGYVFAPLSFVESRAREPEAVTPLKERDQSVASS